LEERAKPDRKKEETFHYAGEGGSFPGEKGEKGFFYVEKKDTVHHGGGGGGLLLRRWGQESDVVQKEKES